MSSHLHIPFLSIGSRRRLVVALVVTLLALLSLAASRVHAQENKIPDHLWHVGGIGRVEVVAAPGISCPSNSTPGTTSGLSLTLDEGGTAHYCLRLTKQPVPIPPQTEMDYIDDWWVMLRLSDGGVPISGDGDKFQLVPSVGWQFTEDNWNQWRSVSIKALQDEDGADHRLTISHEVWDSHTNCPYLGNEVGLQVFDDEGPNARLPALTIEDVTVNEGDRAEFTVRLTKSSTGTVTVDYETVDGTAQAGSDYTSIQRTTLEFTAGQTLKTISVQTTEDTIPEQAEAFTVRLSNQSGASLARATATGTINDDDVRAEVTISDVTVEEGEDAVFTISLSSGGSQSITVAYATANGTAVAPSDYSTVSETLVLNPGGSQTITVETTEDTTPEPTETFSVTLTDNADNSFLAAATGTINDDDVRGDVTIGDVTVEEGEDAVFTISLSSGGSQSITVAYATANGTAVAPSDYSTVSETLVLNPGGSQTITVETTEDTTPEPTETFSVTLTDNADNSFLAAATGTINDDDVRGDVTIGDVTVEEGEDAVFTISLSSGGSQSITVAYATANGTAVAPSDYSTVSETLVLNPGGSQTITVETTEDTTPEPTETFSVTLTDNADNSFLAAATGTINDDDVRGDVTIGDVTVEEGEDAVFTISLSSGGSQSITVAYATANGTAVAPSDYSTVSETLVLNPGGSQTITVETTEDTTPEPTETFSVTLTDNADNSFLAAATGTINDDDDDGNGGGGVRRRRGRRIPGGPEAEAKAAEEAEAEAEAQRRTAADGAATGTVVTPSLPYPSRTRQLARATPTSSSSP